MAVKKPTTKPRLISSGSVADLKIRREFDTIRRDNAANILSPDQVEGLNWRASKILKTTLGGGPSRGITKQDLIAFKKNIQDFKSARNYQIGINANEIIDISTNDDKLRCKQQIRRATPVRMKGGELFFITDSGPQSNVNQHNVHIILAQYESRLAHGTPLQAAKEVCNGNLKFDCDCDHHTFCFRYITTLVDANAGRAETGFPKIRNPTLNGIACKHVLRVMIELSSSMYIWQRVAQMIDVDRKRNADKSRPGRQKTIVLTQREINALGEKQDKRPRAILSKDAIAAATTANSTPLPKRLTRTSNQQSEASIDQFLGRIGLHRSRIAKLSDKN